MPANLSQQYYAAEEAYKKAATPEDRLAALEEMLATIPKHKGTEKLQADIKKRISKFKKDEGKAKGGSRQEDPFLIDAQGAGQVFILGYPNCGKSALVQALTNAKTVVAEYPFSTPLPVPGMMPYLDISVQLVDAPPFIPEGIAGNFSTALRNCDLLMIMIDLADDDCAEHLSYMLEFLKEKRILRDEAQKGLQFLTWDEVVVVGNKIDADGAEERLQMIKELVPDCPEINTLSVIQGINLEALREKLYNALRVIRVYTKKPGKQPDMDKPFVLPVGSTVIELAEQIHKDIAENLKTAKVWGSSKFDGQQVNQDYVLSDQDIVELND